ncbi:MAG TPA: DnaB-like helicase N-terminal domain-containing protein, partial [Spirochaetia bacterium]|nr:DnaB-like helicase N-terminal domain-containing protein [Spirochaetia bacterium]
MSSAAAGGTVREAIPSHNEEAEVATLGAVLIDPEALPAIIALVRPEDFYRGAHQRIFEAVLALFERGQSIDLITVTEELRSRAALEQCGGSAYVSRLTSAVPTSANVEYYARIVQAASIRRTLAKVSREISIQAHDESTQIQVILEEAERRIFEISDRNQTGT